MDDNATCFTELEKGGAGLSSSTGSDSSSADHLVVMVHGILGSDTDWKFGAEQFLKLLPNKVLVHCSERNLATLTLDGVDIMGERLAEEVKEVIKKNSNMKKISFVAHSVGGLVARYAVGRLYVPLEDGGDEPLDRSCAANAGGTICGLKAMNFITVATPHLGSMGNKQVPFLFGVSMFERAATRFVHWIFRRTGRHLFLTDNDESKSPLLQRMLEDEDGLYFMSALRAFRRRVVYSNVGCDHIVGWRTSSIRRNTELPEWEECVDERYPHIVHEEHCKASDTKCRPTLVSTEDSEKLEEELVVGLSRVSWEKVDVSFHSCRNKFAAHSVIQVKDHIIHKEGEDVIHHMIHRFLLL